MKSLSAKRRYHNERQRLQRSKATPKWVDIEIISLFYANKPEGMHVDHIVPINHKEVCGLHVPWNLQYLSAKENGRKRNSFGDKAVKPPKVVHKFYTIYNRQKF